MPKTILLMPDNKKIGLTNISLGIVKLMEDNNIKFRIFKLINYYNNFIKDKNIKYISSFNINYIKFLLSNNQKNILIENIIQKYKKISKKIDILLVEGLPLNYNNYFLNFLNYEISKILDAEIILISTIKNNSFEDFKIKINLLNIFLQENNINKISGIILNKINFKILNNDKSYITFLDISKKVIIKENTINFLKKNLKIPIYGCIPLNLNLICIKVFDIIKYLNANILNLGNAKINYIKYIFLYTSLTDDINKNNSSKTLLIISSKNTKLLKKLILNNINNLKIKTILIIEFEFNKEIKKISNLCILNNLTIFTIKLNIYKTFIKLKNISKKNYLHDYKKVYKLKKYFSYYIDKNWIFSFKLKIKKNNRISPHLFKYKIIELAKKANKKIILPEGNELRIIKAASICQEKGIANCILLGNSEEINKISKLNKINIKNIEIIDPNIIREKYITRLITLRKHKGIDENLAKIEIKNDLVLANLILEQNEVDGLVAGIKHTTAQTIRPSLQIIRTAKDNTIISSIFFMLLQDKVILYTDCAINLDPTYKQLAEIAIQSFKTAIKFNIKPKIAMISYSTKTSGFGPSVEKVNKATILAKKIVPQLIIDGPLQYDAASVKEISKIKSPESPIKGDATIFVFPDLNTGNTTYKAVQRVGNLIAIGPILQGIRKPINDLSRGASIEDIVYTIAITAIQA